VRDSFAATARAPCWGRRLRPASCGKAPAVLDSQSVRGRRVRFHPHARELGATLL